MKKHQLKSVRSRLDRFLKDLLDTLGRSERRHWAAFYVLGLLTTIERKTAAGIASQFPDGNVQAVQQMLQGSPWDHMPVHQALTRMAIAEMKPVEVCIIDDTGFPKKGKLSVGVARQYSGVHGKVENCQIAVSFHYATEHASFPMGWRLYLPECWIADQERRRKAGIPEEVTFQRKWELALDLIDSNLNANIPMGVIVADASYGNITEFREGLETRLLKYAVGIEGKTAFWRQETLRQAVPCKKPKGRISYRYPTDAQPESAREIAESLPDSAWEEITYRKGTKGLLKASFAMLRVQPAHGFRLQQPEQPMVWLLIQRTPDKDSPYDYYLSNLDETATPFYLARTIGLRWRIEMDYQTLKGQTGLDHFEGRSWRGWHHHVALSTTAFVFLLLERLRGDFPPSAVTDDPS